MSRKKPVSKTGQQSSRANIQGWIRDTIENEGQVARIPAKIAATLQCSVSGVQNAFKVLEGAGVIQRSEGNSQVFIQGRGMKQLPPPVETSAVEPVDNSEESEEAEVLRDELISAYKRIVALHRECLNLQNEIWEATVDGRHKAINRVEVRISELQGK